MIAVGFPLDTRATFWAAVLALSAVTWLACRVLGINDIDGDLDGYWADWRDTDDGVPVDEVAA